MLGEVGVVLAEGGEDAGYFRGVEVDGGEGGVEGGGGGGHWAEGLVSRFIVIVVVIAIVIGCYG